MPTSSGDLEKAAEDFRDTPSSATILLRSGYYLRLIRGRRHRQLLSKFYQFTDIYMLVHGVLPRRVGDVLLSNVAEYNLLRFLETSGGQILVSSVLDVVAETVSCLPLCLVELFLFHNTVLVNGFVIEAQGGGNRPGQ